MVHVRRRPRMTARFIGVQLEIESPRPLGHLFDSFSGAGVVSVDYRESTRLRSNMPGAG
jgi:hypothetical protein